jgi:hypothetical protein
MAFATSVGCAVDTAPTTDAPVADPPAQVATSSGRPTVDSTPVPAKVGTILSKVTTAEGRTFQFGRAPSDAIWVEEQLPLGTPPSLPELSKLHPSVVDIFREVSGAAETPAELSRPIRSAAAVPPPPPAVREDFFVAEGNLTSATQMQVWFELTTCMQSQVGGFYGTNGICIIGNFLPNYTDCEPTAGPAPWLNPPCSPYYIAEYGSYFSAFMLDSSCPILDVGYNVTWFWNGAYWQEDWASSPFPGRYSYVWLNDSGLTYRFSSTWWGSPPACPGAVAMGD